MLLYSQSKISTDIHKYISNKDTGSFFDHPPGVQHTKKSETKTPLHACITTRRLAMLVVCGQICKSILQGTVDDGVPPFSTDGDVLKKYQKGFPRDKDDAERDAGKNKQTDQQLPPKGNNCAMDVMAMSFVGILTKKIFKVQMKQKRRK